VFNFETQKAEKAERNKKMKKIGWWVGSPVAALAVGFAIWTSGIFGNNANKPVLADAGDTGPAYAQKAKPGDVTSDDVTSDIDIKVSDADAETDAKKSDEPIADTEQKTDTSNPVMPPVMPDPSATDTNGTTDVDADATNSTDADDAQNNKDEETVAADKETEAEKPAPSAEADKDKADAPAVDAKTDADAKTNSTITLNGKPVKVTFGTYSGFSLFTLDKENAADFFRRTAADYWASDKAMQENHDWEKLQTMDPKFAEAAKKWADYVEKTGHSIKREDGSMGWVPTSADENVYNPMATDTSNAEIEKILEEVGLTGDDVLATVEDANADDDPANHINAAPDERGAHLTDPDQGKAQKLTETLKAISDADATAHANVAATYVQNYFPDAVQSVFAANNWDITSTQLGPSGLMVELANGETVLLGNGFVKVYGDGDLSPEALALTTAVIQAQGLNEDQYSGECKKQVVEAMKTAAAKPTGTPANAGAKGAPAPGV
nr:hypothetical protein [Alphaproteobacteria bacterium]